MALEVRVRVRLNRSATSNTTEAQMGDEQALRDRINNDFTYHRPPPEKGQVFVDIREAGKAMAHKLVDSCPMGRELSTALTKLEEAVMHANAAIARQFPVEAP